MANQYKNFQKGFSLIPKAATLDGPYNTVKGDIELLSSTNKLYFHNGSINDPIVQENVTATLTNKTLTAPIINNATADTITGIAGGDLSLQSSVGNKVVVEAVTFDSSTISASTDLNINSTGGSKTYFQVTGTNVARVDADGIAFLTQDAAKFYDADSSNYVGIKAPAVVGTNYTITLPASAPNPNTALVYDGTDYKWGSAGGGDASGSNDDVLATAFRARILDTFEDQNTASSSSINSSATTASWSSLNQYYTIQYSNTTISSATTTTPTLAATPAFLAVGDVIILGSEVRKVTNLSPLTIEAAFSTASGSCTVSETVATKELYGSALDGASISSAFGGSSFSEYLVDYQDSTTAIYTPNISPLVAYSASQDNVNWSAVGTRPTLQTDQIQSATFAAPGIAIYVRLFANVTVGSGSVNLLEYRTYMQKSPIVTSGTLNQAYARFDGSITPQYCTTSVVSGKTRVTLSWTYATGVSTPNTYGAIDVYINGQFIPRQVGSYLPTGAFYKEISSTVIELDTDYSATPYAIQVLQRQPMGNYVSASGSSSSTSGSGLKNYITTYKNNPGNGDFELGDLTGWDYLASGVTIDPTTKVPSGTPTFASSVTGITNTVIATNPLAATYSLSSAMTTAASIQGKGFASKAFTIDIEDQAKVLGFKFAYKLASDAQAGTANAFNASGTSSNTLAVYIYDVTAGAWIQPAGVYNIVQSSGVGYATGTFQTSSTSTQYRIVILNINTYLTNCTVVFDDFFVGPQISVSAPPMSDWTSFTPIITNGTGGITNYTASGLWRRVGGNIEIRGKIIFSAASAVFNRIYASIPTGLSIDSTRLVTGSQNLLGTATALDNTVANYVGGNALYVSASTIELLPAAINVFTGVAPVYSPGFGNTFPFTFNTADEISWEISAPITGWSSNTVSSADTDTRVVAAKFGTTSSRAINNTTPVIIFENKVYDTHGAYNSSTGAYTVPVSGYYKISGYLRATAIALPNGNFSAYQIKINGLIPSYGYIAGTRSSSASTYNPEASGSNTFFLNAGDVITIGGFSDTANTTYTDGSCSVEIERISGPSVIQATETVAASYYLSVSATLNNNVLTYVDYPNKAFDTHGIYTAPTGAYSAASGGWATTQPKWTIPVSGKYQVTAATIISAGAAGSQNYGLIQIDKNGTGVKVFQHSEYSANTYSPSNMVNGIIQCNAGDVITIRTQYQAATLPTSTLVGSQGYTYFDIVRVGN